jgi:hypothetical protein
MHFIIFIISISSNLHLIDLIYLLLILLSGNCYSRILVYFSVNQLLYVLTARYIYNP